MAVGRGSPVNLISKITNPRVLDHLNLISVACKDHNTLLPVCGASISPPASPLQVSQYQMKKEGRARWLNRGPDPEGSRECEAAFKQRFEWLQIHHVWLTPGRQRWPRWRLSVMIDGLMSVWEHWVCCTSVHAAGGHDLLLLDKSKGEINSECVDWINKHQWEIY